jgi:uncharacterized membrane protein
VDATEVLTIATAVGAGLAGGVFYAFSTFVMQGLGRAPARAGLVAMQGINETAPRPPLLLAMFGTSLAALGLGVAALGSLDEAEGVLRLVAAVLCLVPVLTTIAWHVPRNDALAALDADAPDAPAAWERFRRTWTAVNHVRTVAYLAAAVLLTIAVAVA